MVVNVIAERVPVAVERMRGSVRELVAKHLCFGAIAREVIPEDAAQNVRVAARIISLAVCQLLGEQEHGAIAERYWQHGALRGSAAGGFGAGDNASIRKALLATGKEPWSDSERRVLLQLGAILLHIEGNHAGTPDFHAIARALNAQMHGGRPVRSYESVKKQHRAVVLAQQAENTATNSPHLP